MLNFAEQTGSGAVMLVWSFPSAMNWWIYIISFPYWNRLINDYVVMSSRNARRKPKAFGINVAKLGHFQLLDYTPPIYSRADGETVLLRYLISLKKANERPSEYGCAERNNRHWDW